MAGIIKKKDIYAESLELHEKYLGKIEVHSKVPITNRRDLSLAYTPGVGAVCKDPTRQKPCLQIYAQSKHDRYHN